MRMELFYASVGMLENSSTTVDMEGFGESAQRHAIVFGVFICVGRKSLAFLERKSSNGEKS